MNQRIYEILQQAHAAGFRLDECLILSPRRGSGGVDDPGVNGLNAFLQGQYNPTGEPIKLGAKEMSLRLGDRVIETKNKYGDLDVRNGDVGTILAVNYGKNGATPTHAAFSDGTVKGVLVRFDYGREVVYPFDQLAGLELGYCITVHKSQGSQAKFVIMVCRVDHMMCRRELVYTGLTRAQLVCVLIGTMEALQMSVAEARREVRNTALEERLT